MAKKGQSTTEYLYLLGIIAVALISMAIYMRRGVSGYVRNLADEVGEQYSWQSSSVNSTEVKNIESSIISETTTTTSGSKISSVSTTDEETNETVSRNVSEGLGGYVQEVW